MITTKQIHSLTTRQAASTVGISLMTLNLWIRDGKVRAPKPILHGARGMRLWNERDIERLRTVKQKIYRRRRK